MPRLRRVRPCTRGTRSSAPSAASRSRTRARRSPEAGSRADRATIRHAGRAAAGRRTARLEESPDTTGQDAGGNPRRRKPTESGTERKPPAAHLRRRRPVRVKRWGKSPPASWRHGGSPNPVRCKTNRLRPRRPAEEPGRSLEPPGNRRPRWMVALDKIRLTGLLRKKPWKRGFFYQVVLLGTRRGFGQAAVRRSLWNRSARAPGLCPATSGAASSRLAAPTVALNAASAPAASCSSSSATWA